MRGSMIVRRRGGRVQARMTKRSDKVFFCRGVGPMLLFFYLRNICFFKVPGGSNIFNRGPQFFRGVQHFQGGGGGSNIFQGGPTVQVRVHINYYGNVKKFLIFQRGRSGPLPPSPPVDQCIRLLNVTFRSMRFPTMWNVRLAKNQTSLRIRAV